MQSNQPYMINHTSNRTFVNVPNFVDPNVLNTSLSALLSNEGYSLTTYTESGAQEVVWKKGTGMATAMKYIKLVYQPNLLIISAWICPGMFSLTICEIALNGVYAFVPKKNCMKTVEKLAQTAVSMNQQAQSGYAPQAQPGYAPQAQQNFAPQAQQPGYIPQAQPGYAPQSQQNSVPQPQSDDTAKTE